MSDNSKKIYYIVFKFEDIFNNYYDCFEAKDDKEIVKKIKERINDEYFDRPSDDFEGIKDVLVFTEDNSIQGPWNEALEEVKKELEIKELKRTVKRGREQEERERREYKRLKKKFEGK